MKTNFLLKLLSVLFLFNVLTSCEEDSDDVNSDPDPDPDPTEEDIKLSGSYDEDLYLSNEVDDPEEADYIVEGDVEINAKLTVEPGVRIEFEEDTELLISSTGFMVAEGTESELIVFTSAEQQAGKYWKGIRVESSDDRNAMAFAVVEFAGNTNMKLGPYSSQNRQTNVGVDDDASLSVENCSIKEGKGYGLFVRGRLNAHYFNSYNNLAESALSVHVRNAGVMDVNTSYSGSSHDGPEIFGSKLEEEITISELRADASYKVSGSLEIEAPLFISEGVVIELDEDVMIDIKEGSVGSSIDGYIDVAGTADMPVVFTTANLEGGQHWKGIRVSTSDTRNNMDNVVIEYAGNSSINIGSYSSQNRQANVAVDGEASLTLTNAVVSNSKAWGVAAIATANLTIENVQYSNNPEGNLADGI